MSGIGNAENQRWDGAGKGVLNKRYIGPGCMAVGESVELIREFEFVDIGRLVGIGRGIMQMEVRAPEWKLACAQSRWKRELWCDGFRMAVFQQLGRVLMSEGYKLVRNRVHERLE